MFRKVIERLMGKRRARIHSHIVKPLNHKGIYEYQDYLRYLLKEERKKNLPSVEWQEEQKGA